MLAAGATAIATPWRRSPPSGSPSEIRIAPQRVPGVPRMPSGGRVEMLLSPRGQETKWARTEQRT